MKNQIMKNQLEIIGTILLTAIMLFLKACFLQKELIVILVMSLNIIYLSYRLREMGKNIMIFYFSICNFIFNTSISLTKLIKHEYILKSMFFTKRIPFSEEVSKFVYDLLILNNIGILIGIFIIYYSKKVKNIYMEREGKRIISKYLPVILIIFFIFILKINLENIKEVMRIGYAKSYLRIKNKDLIYYFTTIFSFIFTIYLGIKPKKDKKLKIVLLINILIALISSFAGSRAKLLVEMVFFIWYLEVQNYFKIRKKYAILLVFLVFIYSIKLSNVRESYGKNNYSITINKIESLQILRVPLKFLESQNETASLIGYIKLFPEIIEGENYGKMILASYNNFYNSFFKKELLMKNKSKEIGKKMNDFSRISYIVNYNYVKIGAGLGGNYIVEMYEVGKYIGVLILSVFFILLIFYLENLFKRDRSVYSNIFVLLVFQSIFMAPRSYYFDFNVREYLWLCLVYFILLQFIKQIKTKI